MLQVFIGQKYSYSYEQETGGYFYMTTNTNPMCIYRETMPGYSERK
jgi:hypothetical protein